MNDDIVVRLIDALIPFSLLLAVLVAIWLLREPLSQAIPGVRRVKVAGVELELAGAALVHERSDRLRDSRLAESLVERATAVQDRLSDFRVLWVDDWPENNEVERRFLRRAGATVVNALTTDDALRELRSDDVDLVITDFDRDGNLRAGIELAASMRKLGHHQPVLAFIGEVDASRPNPAHIDLVTDHPDVLLARVLDIA